MENGGVVGATGGSSGIGRATLRFAGRGDKVLITGRRPAPSNRRHPSMRTSPALLRKPPPITVGGLGLAQFPRRRFAIQPYCRVR
jgi:NAD(P)-dependent dehydrogenase (short-subunit alcohol dehydrogenase family)